MDRKTYILSQLETMTTSDLHVITGLDITIQASGTGGNLVWTVESVGDSVRGVILSELKEMVTEAYEADGVDPRDSATVLPWIENLRRETRLIDYMVIDTAHRMAPLSGEYAVEIGSRTTIQRIISDAVQEVYDQAAHRLVQHLENLAANAPNVEL